MTFSNFLRNLNDFIGEVATTHPESWVMGWAFLGLATGVLMYSAVGFGLGSLLSHPQVGMWFGLGMYSYWLAVNADQINGNLDSMVATLKSLR